MLNIQMNPACSNGYNSGSQVTRRVTEAWGGENLYCLSCASRKLAPSPNNSQAVDFRCESCSAAYQLKASKKWSERRVPDAGYDAMVRALKSDCVPNLLVMQYDPDWTVQNLLLVPSFFFSLAAIEKRPPLGPNARRAGWVGCNILLHRIAPEGKIRIITERAVISPRLVREQYAKLRPLATLGVDPRGWTLDVLRIVKSLKTIEFCLGDVYRMEPELAALHPDNRNVRAKIRQQLQVLRDLGLLRFLGKGRYSLQ